MTRQHARVYSRTYAITAQNEPGYPSMRSLTFRCAARAASRERNLIQTSILPSSPSRFWALWVPNFHTRAWRRAAIAVLMGTRPTVDETVVVSIFHTGISAIGLMRRVLRTGLVGTLLFVNQLQLLFRPERSL